MALSISRVGSVSKPITAAAIMLLVDQGKIDLDKTVWGRNGYLGENCDRFFSVTSTEKKA